jgi:hypothetical protein
MLILPATLIEAESLFNDGTSFVFFLIWKGTLDLMDLTTCSDEFDHFLMDLTTCSDGFDPVF